MERERIIKVDSREAGKRLDVFLAQQTRLSRSLAQKVIAEGRVRVNGLTVRKNHKVCPGEEVTWEALLTDAGGAEPQNIPLSVVFEDGYLAVIDKPAGMVMYPGPGHTGDTLVNALLAMYPEIAVVGGRGRPGIFHRLDRGTSGLVAVALTRECYQAMVDMMQRRKIKRKYTALVVGEIGAERGTIDAPLGRSHSNRKRMAVDRYSGRRAVSRFSVLERFEGYTLVEVVLETGRTHQIRVHFSHIGHPVAGDPDYSRRKSSRRLELNRQFLHAGSLSFRHPVTGDELSFTSELPADLRAVLDALRVSGGI